MAGRTSRPHKAPRGFAALTPAERRELGRRGGLRAQRSGKVHRFTVETARAAGRLPHDRGTAFRFDSVSGAIAGRLNRKPLPNPHVAHGDLLDRLLVGQLSAVDLVLCVRDLLALGESLSTLHELRPATEPVVLTPADRETLASHEVPEVVYWFLGVPAPDPPSREPTPDRAFASRFPELAREWHPTRNGALLPTEITYGSARIVWWQCQADPWHVWAVSVNARTSNGTHCPDCARARRAAKSKR